MPRVFLNRSVQIRPKSWRDIVQGIFSQVLTHREVSQLPAWIKKRQSQKLNGKDRASSQSPAIAQPFNIPNPQTGL